MTHPKKTASYGTWESPINAERVAKAAVGIQQIAIDGDDVYWIESRPQQNGRYVVVGLEGDRMKDVTPSGFSARSLVYDYGGGALITSKGVLYYSNYSTLDPSMNDQRLYRQDPGMRPEPLTEAVAIRYADGVIDHMRGRIVCVAEDFTDGGLVDGEPMVSIVAIDLEGRKLTGPLVQGGDYYAAPALSPDGQHLAWITWNKPNMPWDDSMLFVGEVGASGDIEQERRISARAAPDGKGGESVFQPQWSPDGKHLYFVSDQNNWWSIYRYSLATRKVELVSNEAPERSEFGASQWNLGMSCYAFVSDKEIVAAYARDGVWALATIDVRGFAFTPIDVGLPGGSRATELSQVRAANGTVYMVAGSQHEPSAILALDVRSKRTRVLQVAGSVEDTEFLSSWEPVRFPLIGDSEHKGHAFYYPPHNPSFEGLDGELPPVVVKTHGGPTSAASTALNQEIHYFTSRGFGVVDVNYRGSTGFGRDYRLALYGGWGVRDRDDCVSAVKALAEAGKVDIGRVVARGVSAGGYLTVVQATYTSMLAAGASYSGISDLLKLYAGTHKFERYYILRLVGSSPDESGLPIAERTLLNTYELRSPACVAGLIRCGMIFFQGSGDKVVPPDQTQTIVEAMEKAGQPVAFILFDDEQHGLRIGKNIVRALEAELYFYSQLMGFEPADRLPGIEIRNWPPVRP